MKKKRLSLLVVLPTQSINLSAAYSGAALVVALLYSAGRLIERTHDGGRRLPAVFALVCLPAVSLAVFKLTFASFAGLYLAGLLVAVPRGARLRAIGTGTLVASVLVLPWAVVVADTHAAGLRGLWESGIEPSAGRLSWGGLPSLLAARA